MQESWGPNQLRSLQKEQKLVLYGLQDVQLNLQKLINWQNGTFAPVYEIKKKNGQKTSFEGNSKDVIYEKYFKMDSDLSFVSYLLNQS